MTADFGRRPPHRAQQRLAAWVAAAPHRAGYWEAVEAVRTAQGHTVPRWPRYAFLPVLRAGEIVAAAHRSVGMVPSVASIVAETMALAGLASWRMTQGVYRYDPTLYEALISTPLTGDLPVALLQTLPEWCVYIETPGMSAPAVDGEALQVHGVYAWLDWEARGDLTYLQIGLDIDDVHLPVSAVPLVGTLDESIAAVEREWSDAHDRHEGIAVPTDGYGAAAKRFLPPIISLVLYLCADEPDMAKRPARPEPKRVKGGWRLFPAAGLRVWPVGERIGAAIRGAQETDAAAEREALASGRARPRPHVRRAHWHSYWRGPREGERTLTAKWQPPIAVNVDGSPMPTVVHEVE